MALLLDRTAAARGGRRGAPGRVRRPGPGGGPAGRPAAGDRAGRGPAAGALARASSPSASTTCSARSTPAGKTPTSLATRRRLAGGWIAGTSRTRSTSPRRRWTWRRSPQTRAAQRSATQRHATMQATVTWSYRTLGPARRPAAALAVGLRRPGRSGHCGVAARRRPARPALRAGRQVDDPGRAARRRQHLPDARPDPGVRGPATGRRRRGAERPRPARGLVRCTRCSGRTSAPTAGRSPCRCTRSTRSPTSCAPRCAGRPPAAAPARACNWPAGSTSGGASAGWPGRAGSGCSGSTVGSPRPASGSPRRSWRRRTTCTRCTPAPTASSPRSCGSRSGPRRPPGRPATPGCWPGCSPAGPRR